MCTFKNSHLLVSLRRVPPFFSRGAVQAPLASRGGGVVLHVENVGRQRRQGRLEGGEFWRPEKVNQHTRITRKNAETPNFSILYLNKTFFFTFMRLRRRELCLQTNLCYGIARKKTPPLG